MLKEFVITEKDSNQHIEKYIRKVLNELSLGQIYKLFRKKDIKINGKWVDKSYVLVCNDKVQVYLPNDFSNVSNNTFKKVKYDLNIVYEDDNILVISKPYGILVQEGSNNSITLTKQVISYLIDTGSYDMDKDKGFIPAPLHRLDRNTSGLIIFGKNLKALQVLGEAFRQHKNIIKQYLVLTFNKIDKQKGTIKLRLLKNEKDNFVKVVSSGGEESITEYKVLKTNDDYSLVEATLVTGKTHQIRVHFASIGNPVVGDKKYGDFSKNDRFFNDFKWENQFLHSYRLSFNNFKGEFEYLNGIFLEDKLSDKEIHIIDNLF